MTATINKKEKEALERIFTHPMFESIVEESDLQMVESIRAKINKKKIDKKAEIPPFQIKDEKGRTLKFEMAKENGSLLVIADKESFSNTKKGYIFTWEKDKTILIDLTNYLYGISLFWGDVLLVPYHKGYGDEINVYENEVERTYNLGQNRFYFDCYTGDESDDNWTRIRPSRAKALLKMMVAYLFLDNDAEKYLPLLHEDIQLVYPKWKERLLNNDLETG